LLPAAFILSIVGLCLSGKSKGTSIAAVIIAIVGVIVGAVVFFAVVRRWVPRRLRQIRVRQIRLVSTLVETRPAIDIAVKFVGSDNRAYDDSCGVIPNPLNEVGALYNGGSAQGNVRVAVPAGAEGLWTVCTSIR